MKYSLARGIWKGVKWVLVGLISVSTVAGVSDLTLVDLFDQYLRPAVGSLTVGGVLVLALNFIKTKWPSKITSKF